MKKIFLLAIAVSVAAVTNAQQSIRFKYGYLPKHSYKVNAKNDMDMEMAMSSSDSATNAQLKGSAMKSPMLMKMNMNMGFDMQTGAAAVDKTFPFTLTYHAIDVKAALNGKETPMPKNALVGQVVKGECSAEGKMQFETITGGDMSDAKKNAFKEIFNKMMAQIKFPDREMSVGETFTQEMPMSIPAAGMNMDFTIKTVYKLTDVKGNLAYFDTQSNFDMSINTQTNGVALTGKGNGDGVGKMVYNVTHNFLQTMDTDMVMNFNMDMKNMTMGMKIKGKTSMITDIAAN